MAPDVIVLSPAICAWHTRRETAKRMTWEQNDKHLTLLFLETGTHADIFGW